VGHFCLELRIILIKLFGDIIQRYFMIIAIASKRGPKVEAVKKCFESIKQFFTGTQIEFLSYEIDAGIIMPRSITELMEGAKKRTMLLHQTLQSENQHADFFIGMEGGFHSIQQDGKEIVFLQSWAYVTNGSVGFYGSSGNVAVPEKIATEVMINKRDLSEVIDEFVKQADIRSKQGTWGILTKDLLTRQQSFEIALTAAFAPFYNSEIFG
jgi:non-canonical (house-cleaning) NTP pyrophosphatase